MGFIENRDRDNYSRDIAKFGNLKKSMGEIWKKIGGRKERYSRFVANFTVL